MELQDQSIRQRFIDEHDRNFSVIAPAGVGKTTAIAQKIASIVRTGAIPLARLIVVTYTQKAAQELRQRTLLEVQKQHGNVSGLRHIFFGTIHAFADQLLRRHGHFLNIASDFEIEQNEKQLWIDFLRVSKVRPDTTLFSALLSGEALYNLVEHYYACDVYTSELDGQAFFTEASKSSVPFPEIDVALLLQYDAKNNASISKFQNDLRIWIQNPTFPFPKLTTKSETFLQLYEDVMTPFEDRCSKACVREFKRIVAEYSDFRIRQKRLTFSDLIQFSVDLLEHKEAGHLLRQYYVILDEAQDTDKRQFQLLLGIAQRATIGSKHIDYGNFESSHKFSDCFKNPPAPGRYCMVGDPQQSIYADRADVSFYQDIHQTLTAIGAMEALNFSTTLRFGAQVAQCVNRTFSSILDGLDRQVAFSQITSGLVQIHKSMSPDIGKSPPIDQESQQINAKLSQMDRKSPQISPKLPQTSPEFPQIDQKSLKMDQELPRMDDGWFRMNVTGDDELAFLVHFFKQKTSEYFGIKKWSDLALLCPRRTWLLEIQEAFLKESSVPKMQLHSGGKTYAEYREFAWIWALVVLMLNPKNEFEFSGVLREILGVSDSLIAAHYRGHEIPEILTFKKQFFQWHKQCQYLSPIQVVDFLFQVLDLRARLMAIQDHFDDAIEITLRLCALDCTSLFEFSKNLKRKSAEVFQPDSVDENALQLYTFHKSKGLEWQVVILPFINRKQTPAPCILPQVVNGNIAISHRQYRQWIDPHAAIHNTERLLYVALTRQKRFTIFIDDGRKPQAYSTVSILQSTTANQDLTLNLLPFDIP